MEKPKLGIIGYGQHAERSHVKVGLDFFDVTAVFDPSPKRVAVLRKLVGQHVVAYDTAEELCANAGVDAIYIGSPDADHADQLRVATAAGFHTLVEKPMATTAEELALVREAFDIARGSGLIVASCHPRRSLHHPDLAYGWVKANLAQLTERFGRLWRVGLVSNYPRPTGWKEIRSFLLDKFGHDIDFLRSLLGDLPFTAERILDSADHYQVKGVMNRGLDLGLVEFDAMGMRLHGAAGEFVEAIVLNFAHGSCTVYPRTGIVRYHDDRLSADWEDKITPMTSEGYDRISADLMGDFAVAVQGGKHSYSLKDLWVNTASGLALVGPGRSYIYAP